MSEKVGGSGRFDMVELVKEVVGLVFVRRNLRGDHSFDGKENYC